MRGLGHDCPPLGQGGRASLLVELAADEMALLVEMVGDGSVDRGEFPEGLHPPEPQHGALSSSERRCEFSALSMPRSWSDIAVAPELLSGLRGARYLLADKGYDADSLRQKLHAASVVP